MKRTVIALLLFTALCTSVFAQNASDFTTSKNVKGGITITGYTSTTKNVIIPSTIGGVKVTEIGKRAFYKNKNITGVTVPDSVTSIGGWAFFGCFGLANVNIPNSVASIDQDAFGRCRDLTSVIFTTGSNIPDDMFGVAAFPEGSEGDGGNSLKTAYATGKAGTYTREAEGDTWTKKQ